MEEFRHFISMVKKMVVNFTLGQTIIEAQRGLDV
jgi:hypothetical protein